MIHELQRTRRDRLAHHPAHRFASTLVAGIADAQGGHGLGRGQQFQGGLGDVGQGALRAHQQTGEIVGGGIFGGAPTAVDDASVAGDRGESQHMVAGGAVFHRARARRIHRQVAADAAVGAGAGVGRIHQATRAREAVDLIGDHARFHHHQAVRNIELDDLLHALEAHHHATWNRHRPADVSGTRAARGQGNAVEVREAHDLDHMVLTSREQHRLGHARPGRLVTGVVRQGLRIAEGPIRAEQGLEFREEGRRQRGVTPAPFRPPRPPGPKRRNRGSARALPARRHRSSGG